MTEPTLKLPRSADELLQAFPAGEPDFEAQAKAIEARLTSELAAPELDVSKAPELAAEPGEPPAPSRVRAAASKSNFAEMARKSLHKKEDDSTQIAKELLAATAQSRRPSAEMVERVRAAGKATPATASPLPLAAAATEDAQRPSGVVARAEAARPATATNNRGTLIGIAGAALALAACIALFLKQEPSESATTAALAKELAAEHEATPAPAKPALPAAPAPDQAGVLSPEALAAAPAIEPVTAAAGAARKQGAAAAIGPGALASKAASAPSADAKPEAVVLEDEPEAAKAPNALAEQKAEPEPALKPAEGSSAGVPLTPSAGAVSTALSSVRGGAQACLAGQSDAVTAVVTFAADGHVLRVSAGGPSGACIQAALSKARIQPFARDSFSATTTIRPP